MAKKTPIDKLDTAIKKILLEYTDTFKSDLDNTTKAVAKAGAAAIRSLAKGYGWKRYPDGWTYEVQSTRISSRATIFRSKSPGWAHLLEKGHALPGGGRTEAKPHIQPVEEKLQEVYFDAVQNAILGKVGQKGKTYDLGGK